MPKFLLDSNIIISYLRGEAQGVEMFSRIAEQGRLVCSVMSVFEIEAGIRCGEEERTGEFLGKLETYNVDAEIATLAGRHSREFRAKGITLAVPDLIIAATAAVHDLTIVTANPRHYPMEGLRIYGMEER